MLLLSDLIKSLVDVAIEYGECEVYITTQNENQMYDNVLLHGLPFKSGNVLRLEGIDAETYDELEAEELNYEDESEEGEDDDYE